MENTPLAIVAGAGPGLGQGLVQSLTEAGYQAVGLARQATSQNIIACDLTNAEEVAQKVSQLMESHGTPDIVIHNPAKLVIAPFEETSLEDFQATWGAMVLSAVNLAKVVLPAMAARGSGNFLVSGATASLRGGKNFSAFSSAKAGLRALTQSLAREYGTKGIHVAHVILDGIIDTNASRALHNLPQERMMQPKDIAQAYLQLTQQPQSTWTHELDLRPMGEAF